MYFLGFTLGMKQYLLFNQHNRSLFTSRNTIFHEDIFPYQLPHSTDPTHVTTISIESTNIPFLFNINPTIDNQTTPQTIYPNAIEQNISPTPPYSPHIKHNSHPIDVDHTLGNVLDNDNNCAVINDNISNTYNTRQSTRIKTAPAYLKDFICQTSTTCHSYKISNYISYANLAHAYHSYITAITTVSEPLSYKEASIHSHWLQAMSDEIKALTANQTWTITKLPPSKKKIGCKGDFKTKFKSDGTNERYKARLVAQGFKKIQGIDFFHTFSPVAKLTFVRILLSLASSLKPFLYQLDVHNSIFHGYLDEEV